MKSILVAATWFNGRIMAAVRLKHTTQKEPAEDNSYPNVYFFHIIQYKYCGLKGKSWKTWLEGWSLKRPATFLPNGWKRTTRGVCQSTSQENLSFLWMASLNSHTLFFLLLWKGNLFNKSWSCKLPERIGISSCSSLHTSPTLNDFFLLQILHL